MYPRFGKAKTCTGSEIKKKRNIFFYLNIFIVFVPVNAGKRRANLEKISRVSQSFTLRTILKSYKDIL